MRATPIGLLPDADDVVHYAAVQARITHDIPDGIVSAQAAALAAHYARYHLGPVADLPHWVNETVARAGGPTGWDLPDSLLSGLENGPFGRDYLADLDSQLAQRFAGETTSTL